MLILSSNWCQKKCQLLFVSTLKWCCQCCHLESVRSGLFLSTPKAPGSPGVPLEANGVVCQINSASCLHPGISFRKFSLDRFYLNMVSGREPELRLKPLIAWVWNFQNHWIARSCWQNQQTVDYGSQMRLTWSHGVRRTQLEGHFGMGSSPSTTEAMSSAWDAASFCWDFEDRPEIPFGKFSGARFFYFQIANRF